MMLTIAPSIAAYDLVIELGWLTGQVAVQASPAALTAELDQVKAALIATDTPALPLTATRQAYKILGKDPARYRPAAEALSRRVRQGKDLSLINNVIDINNLISLQTGLSIGAYDRATITGPSRLERADETMSYRGIGRGPLNLSALPVLCDAAGPFGSPTSDSERSMVTGDTGDLLMVFYGLAPAKSDAGAALGAAVAEALRHASALLADYAAAAELKTGVVRS